jgi:fructose/tagatose bisphosphate aldolase
MGYITEKKDTMKIIDDMRAKNVSMAVFCTASHWNTEAILLAAKRYADRHGLKKIPVAVGVTGNYVHMAQAARVTYSKDTKTGFIALMQYLKLLCGTGDSPYSCVDALPHLDHADPAKDSWALTDGLRYLASVMFDAQYYPLEKNIELTSDYVRKYGDRVLIEGVMDELSVKNKISGFRDNYTEMAAEYFDKTGVDLLVANLGTEQQSSSVGKSEYLGNRARELTKKLGKAMLVLHGTSSLTAGQMGDLCEDGVIRVNMWTRIAREAGQYAADKLFERNDDIAKGDFEACESMRYIYDSIEKAAQIMEQIFDILGYGKLEKQI